MASAVDPLNVSGATIYSSIKFVPQIAPEVGSLIMILPFGIDSECIPLSQNQFEFHSNILLIFIQNIPLWKICLRHLMRSQPTNIARLQKLHIRPATSQHEGSFNA